MSDTARIAREIFVLFLLITSTSKHRTDINVVFVNGNLRSMIYTLNMPSSKLNQ